MSEIQKVAKKVLKDESEGIELLKDFFDDNFSSAIQKILDIKGKAFNVPVYDLLGGAIRQEIPVYWSHCGTYLIRPEIAELCGVEPLQTIDDLIKLGRRVSDGGYTGLKTNMITFDQS